MFLTQDDCRSAAVAQHDHRDGGFSLIELQAVVVILGVLAAAVVLGASGLRANAADNACPAAHRNLITATESYFVRFDSATIPQADATPDGYERTLVNVGLARQVSQWYDLDAGGELLLPAGSPCTLT